MDYKLIAYENNIRLTEIGEYDDDANEYLNRSSCCGHLYGGEAEIILGVYEDQELKDLSFLHEFAHVKYTYSDWSINHILTRYEWELQVWNNTYKLANEYKFYISPNAMRWAHEQLATYIGWEEREIRNYKRY